MHHPVATAFRMYRDAGYQRSRLVEHTTRGAAGTGLATERPDVADDDIQARTFIACDNGQDIPECDSNH